MPAQLNIVYFKFSGQDHRIKMLLLLKSESEGVPNYGTVAEADLN